MSTWLNTCNLILEAIHTTDNRKVRVCIPAADMQLKSDFGVSVAEWLKKTYPHIQVEYNPA